MEVDLEEPHVSTLWNDAALHADGWHSACKDSVGALRSKLREGDGETLHIIIVTSTFNIQKAHIKQEAIIDMK